jgi:putative ABC transport system ATP-binding protein
MIELSNIRKDYTTMTESIHILNGIDLCIEKGTWLAIMGSSGSGKSSLMNIIGGLDVAYSGNYMLNNLAVHKLNMNELAQMRNKHLGFIFQSFNLLKRICILDNIMLPLLYAGYSRLDAKKQALLELERLNLGHLAQRLPNQLSGGQQQRIAIIRALINKPLIILADEPTGNLDSASSKIVMNWFKALHAQGTSIIMVTHEADIAAYAENVIIMKDGVLV